MGHLSTHVLDTSLGKPGKGIRLVVERIENDKRTVVCNATTNNDGRCDSPLLEGDSFVAGEYEIQFAVGDYLQSTAPSSSQSNKDKYRFLDTVVIRFGIANADEHYHVPLLISPFAYSTYRGS